MHLRSRRLRQCRTHRVFCEMLEARNMLSVTRAIAHQIDLAEHSHSTYTRKVSETTPKVQTVQAAVGQRLVVQFEDVNLGQGEQSSDALRSSTPDKGSLAFPGLPHEVANIGFEIEWGDGTITDARLIPDHAGGYLVDGEHTYTVAEKGQIQVRGFGSDAAAPGAMNIVTLPLIGEVSYAAFGLVVT